MAEGGLVVDVVDGAALGRRAAAVVADEARRAVAERGVFTVAFSGGGTPAPMLVALAGATLPWQRVHVFQVDERAVASDHEARNLAVLRSRLLDVAARGGCSLHPMPVTDDLDAAAVDYADTLRSVCGQPPVLDLVQLGLGVDGHTASLVPGDPVLSVTDRDVAPTGSYAGHRRLTLTYPALNRARRVLWLVAGADKAAAVARLAAADPAIPASHVSRHHARVLVDHAAAADLPEARA